MNKFILFLIVSLLPWASPAEASIERWMPRGWYFYRETHTALKKQSAKESLALSNVDTLSDQDIEKLVKASQKKLKLLKYRALLSPTKAHLAKYIAYQNQQSARASRFSKQWAQTLLYNPELDYSIRHPTRSVARRIEIAKEDSRMENALKRLEKTQKLFFFFKSSCPYCRRFSKILKRFLEKYPIPTVAISLDGRRLPEFPHARTNIRVGALFKVPLTPAVFSISPISHKVVPVSYGLVSQQTLKQRLVALIEMKKKTTFK